MTLDPKNAHSDFESDKNRGRAPLPNGDSLGDLTVLADWRRIPFLMVDSAHTKRFEDAVATKMFHWRRSWSTDLKVIYPLPLTDLITLHERTEQVCLGIRDSVNPGGRRDPILTLAVVENLTRVTDRQAEAFLDGRGHAVTGIAGQDVLEPSVGRRLHKQLRLVRTTALELSFWRTREFTPAHAVGILTEHAQRAAILASRDFDPCPTLIVLRPQGSREVRIGDLKPLKGNARLKSKVVTVASGSAVPTLLRAGEVPNEHDGLRLKDRGNSGAINMTQISCALLGIEPIPDHLVQQGMRSDSQVDKWKNGGPLPDPLAAVVKQRRDDIRAVLKGLTRSMFG